MVARGHADLPQGEVLEDWQDERLHVPLVQLPRALGQSVFELEVFKPVRDQVRKRAVRGERRG